MSPVDGTTIAIMGDKITATHDEKPIDQLLFLPDNPRVYAAIRDMDDFYDLTEAEQQDRIYRLLLEEPSVKKLLPEIRRDGGLQEPVIVRWDRQQVVEGNSRLAVYRKLEEEGADGTWDRIPCQIVTKLTDDQQTRLLGQAHLQGRTEWSSYSKALFCYGWVRTKKNTAQALSQLSGMSVRAINKDVDKIQLMHENNDHNQSHFSYYGVLVENRAISSEVKENQELRDRLLSEIKSGNHFTAQEMRDQLPTVIKKPKILRKFIRGDVPLDEAFDRAKVSDTESRLKRIRKLLDDIEADDVGSLERHERQAVRQVVRQIQRGVTRIEKMVATDTGGKLPSGKEGR